MAGRKRDVNRVVASIRRRRPGHQPWNPHGTYAKELTFFVKYVGLTPLEVIRCAALTGAEIMGREKELGSLEPGKLADVLVVEGDVLADIGVLEDRSRFVAVVQGGVVKAGQLA
jgi:imidazolonepropionase-like amidohydrolase